MLFSKSCDIIGHCGTQLSSSVISWRAVTLPSLITERSLRPVRPTLSFHRTSKRLFLQSLSQQLWLELIRFCPKKWLGDFLCQACLSVGGTEVSWHGLLLFSGRFLLSLTHQNPSFKVGFLPQHTPSENSFWRDHIFRLFLTKFLALLNLQQVAAVPSGTIHLV